MIFEFEGKRPVIGKGSFVFPSATIIGDVIIGKRPGRTLDDEITVFDATGTALQDVATAAAVYEKALERKTGTWFNFQD